MGMPWIKLFRSALIQGADPTLQPGDCSLVSLPFSSTDSEPGNSSGHSSSVQKCQIPKYHWGKVHAAPRQGGLRADQVSISVSLGQGNVWADGGEQKLATEGALIQQFLGKAEVWTRAGTFSDQIADNLHVKV